MNPSMSSGRRLPIYLIIDTSAAMNGVVIDSINEALPELTQRLMRSPETLENGKLSLIVFGQVAEMYDFVSLDEFDPPNLIASGARSLGAALHALAESLQRDIESSRPGYRGDHRPLVILVIGGLPTDNYEKDLQEIMALPAFRRPTFVTIACGENVDVSFLRLINTISHQVRRVTSETLAQVFGLMARTIIHTSRGVTQPESAPPPS